MENTRLIMLEGLPGTGKTTNSQFLNIQLERSGKTAKWVHEVACERWTTLGTKFTKIRSIAP